MKQLIFIALGLIIIISCKKDPSKKAFLMGRLIDNCNGNPVKNEAVYFYQNFTKAQDWFHDDTPEKLLEITNTDENGYFYFTGKDYTNKNTSSIYNSSIRLENGTKLVEGNLGEGKAANNGDSYIKDVGDIIKNGMNINLNVKISSLNNITNYDSVRVFGLSNDGTVVSLTNANNNYFSTSINSLNLNLKNYWAPTDDFYGKYSVLLTMYFYLNGDMNTKEVKYYFFTPCITYGEIVFNF